MPSFVTHAAGVAAGAALAAGNLRLTRRVPAERQVALWAAGLTSAAAIYPLARRRWQVDAAVAREVLGMAAYTAVSVTAGRAASPVGARVAAAGWASHALFDLAHRHSEGSRLPDWYPAVCAGYDLVVAAHLARA